LLRDRGNRGLGIALSLLGMSAVGGGGWLGGHLIYALGVGVDTTAFQHAEQAWTDVTVAGGDGREPLTPARVVAGQLTAGDLDGVPLVLTRLLDREQEAVAYADRCSHRGGPLHEGRVEHGCVVCPWHASAFDLRDGEVVVGPATRPQPPYEVRVVDGRLQARHPNPRSLRTNPVGR